MKKRKNGKSKGWKKTRRRKKALRAKGTTQGGRGAKGTQ